MASRRRHRSDGGVLARARASVIADVPFGCRARRWTAPPYGRCSTRRPLYAGGVTSRAPRYRSRAHTHTHMHTCGPYTRGYAPTRPQGYAHARVANDTHNGVPPPQPPSKLPWTATAESESPRGGRGGGVEKKTHTTRAPRTFSSSPSARLPATSACVCSAFWLDRSSASHSRHTDRDRRSTTTSPARSVTAAAPLRPSPPPSPTQLVRVCVCVCN